MNRENELKPESKAKFYVAITRAKFSVALVLTKETLKNISNIEIYNPSCLL